MKKRNIWIAIIGLLILSLAFTGCASNNAPAEDSESQSEEQVTLKVAATPVPHAEILNFIKPKLEEEGIILDVIEFTDYVTPNLALADEEVDANFFQHGPYLEAFNRERGLDLMNACKVHVEPLGLYSKKISSIDELEDGAIIAIPNDPTNEGRALLLLEAKNIITLSEDAGLEATEKDIVENPKNLVFKPVEAAQLPRTLDDVDAAIINTNYALEGNLNPVKDALIMEGSESPYANILAIRPEDEDNPAIKKLIDALQSEDVKNFINEKYEGSIVPVF